LIQNNADTIDHKKDASISTVPITTNNINSGRKNAKKELTNVVGFVYGGSIIKSGCIYVFCTNNDNVIEYIRKTYTQYFGECLYGGFVKCENAEKALARVLAKAQKEGRLVEVGFNILKC